MTAARKILLAACAISPACAIAGASAPIPAFAAAPELASTQTVDASRNQAPPETLATPAIPARQGVPAPAANPTTAPADEIDVLIAQLGDDDPGQRDQAAQKLLTIGAPALSRLRQAADSDDPETSARATSLVRRLTRRLPPGGTHIRGPVQLQMQATNTSVITDVVNGPQKIHIETSGAKIAMHVSCTEGGEETAEDYAADSPQELRDLNPEAYTLYARWGGERFGAFHINPNGGIVRFAIAQQAAGGDDLDALRGKIQDAMTAAKTPAEQQKQVLDALDNVEDIRDSGPGEKPADYVAASDALRKLLSDLKLPDPGQTLPPPAGVRLGVSLAPIDLAPNAPASGFVVNTVEPNSRGEKIGLRAGDIIEKINGNPVTSVQVLRKIVTDHPVGLMIEGQRGDKPLKLSESK
jgi:hypothetical protein